jgi:hypothetical protein
MLRTIRAEWVRRPWWMNLMFLFCVYMALVRVPLDIVLTPIAHDQEVWFGIVLRGVWAKATEPLHWAVYGFGAWGFWKMRRWMWPWAAVYATQIAVGTLIWNYQDPRGSGALGALLAAGFLVPTIALWRSRPLFERSG